MARLAILIPDMRGGGAERVALSLARGFLDRGREVDLVVLQARGELLSLRPEQVRLVDLDVARIRNAILPLRRYLRNEQPVGLLAMMWPMPIVAIVAKLMAGAATRIVASDHAILTEHYQGQPGKLANLWLTTKAFYPLADRRVAASAGIARDLAAISGLPESRFEVVANPIDMPPANIEVDRETEALWRGKGARILGVGSLKPEKGFDILLKAFAQHRDASLLILGEGPLRAQLKELAVRLGVQDRVAMPGFRADPWPFYASADLFVLSSTSEGFGNVLVEAMAVGLPVVSIDCAGPREVLDGGRYGRLIPVGDVEALAAAMEAALATPGNNAELKERAGQFRPERAVGRYIELLTGKGAA